MKTFSFTQALSVTSESCKLSNAAAVIVPSDLSGHEFVAAAPLRAEPVIAGVLSQIPSESVWRQDYANCILSALLHLNNKRRTSLSEKKEPKCNLSATFNWMMWKAARFCANLTKYAMCLECREELSNKG